MSSESSTTVATKGRVSTATPAERPPADVRFAGTASARQPNRAACAHIVGSWLPSRINSWSTSVASHRCTRRPSHIAKMRQRAVSHKAVEHDFQAPSRHPSIQPTDRGGLGEESPAASSLLPFLNTGRPSPIPVATALGLCLIALPTRGPCCCRPPRPEQSRL